MTSHQHHSTGDEALSHLSTNQGAGGTLVRAYPGSREAESSNWLGNWFKARAEQYNAGSLSQLESVVPFDPPSSIGPEGTLAQPIRLRTLQAQYFRGIRTSLGVVDLSNGLIVIEGRNSSGKTSLAEALEWLFTGSLSRRETSTAGNSRELEDCIGNQFCPDGEDTWVSATFELEVAEGPPQEVQLRRVLKEDYGSASNSFCASTLFLDSTELTGDEERRILDEYFAGIPPLLLQHTLRDFVQGDPKRRRAYFERLLRLDELTELIRLTVISDERATEFPSPSGGNPIGLWRELEAIVREGKSKRSLRQVLQRTVWDYSERVTRILVDISRTECPALIGTTTEEVEVVPILKGEQIKVRQSSFPLLVNLYPQRKVSDDKANTNLATDVGEFALSIRSAWQVYAPAMSQAVAIGEGNLAIAEAYKTLVHAGLIQQEHSVQNCPLCAFDQTDTLSLARINTIRGWDTIRSDERQTGEALTNAMMSWVRDIEKLLLERREILPEIPSEEDWNTALSGASEEIKVVAQNLKIDLDRIGQLEPYWTKGTSLVASGTPCPTTLEECETFIASCTDVVNGVSGFRAEARIYNESLAALESAIGFEASTDPDYRLRDRLVECLETARAIAEDFKWERAKQEAQEDLEQIRTLLINYRQEFLESRRELFSAGMESIWAALRNERYSSFSQLHIPNPRGRGFPIEIEVKAALDDGIDKREVDALRVFSESQVNALGIAAFVTRSKLLGHQLLILDDPVQSMDEDHFKTFARDLIPKLLDDGFQIVLLTHNDTFARDVSHYHYDRAEYVTMSIRNSRREGSVVEEGNRRVPERLQRAEHHLEKGEPDTAWTDIRLAIERLYLIAYKKYGPPDFNSDSWLHQPAEYMWDAGAGEVIQERVPNSRDRLKDILTMTAAGAHDTPARGETEVRNSVAFLRDMLRKLRLGG